MNKIGKLFFLLTVAVLLVTGCATPRPSLQSWEVDVVEYPPARVPLDGTAVVVEPSVSAESVIGASDCQILSVTEKWPVKEIRVHDGKNEERVVGLRKFNVRKAVCPEQASPARRTVAHGQVGVGGQIGYGNGNYVAPMFQGQPSVQQLQQAGASMGIPRDMMCGVYGPLRGIAPKEFGC